MTHWQKTWIAALLAAFCGHCHHARAASTFAALPTKQQCVDNLARAGYPSGDALRDSKALADYDACIKATGIQDGPDGVEPLGITATERTFAPKMYVTRTDTFFISDEIIGFHFEGEEPILYTPAQAATLTECTRGCKARQWNNPGCFLQEVIAYEDSTGKPACKCVWLCVFGNNTHV